MDYLIVEEFNRFWELFAVNERLYPHRRACTPNRNPYFFVQDYGRPRTQTLSFNEYYKLYGTTAERDGWKMTNPTGNQIMYVKQSKQL